MDFLSVLGKLFVENKLMGALLPLGSLGIATFAPKMGPGRAGFIALRSLVKPLGGSITARSSELEFLRTYLLEGDWGYSYIAVTGPKGVGKTCLIESATHRCVGVVNVNISAGLSDSQVKEEVMRQVTNSALLLSESATQLQKSTLLASTVHVGKVAYSHSQS
jgi:hypothetical protein